VAREHFALAGLEGQGEFCGWAMHTNCCRPWQQGPFDFCFIDADKLGYGAYLDWALANIHPGGPSRRTTVSGRGRVGRSDKSPRGRLYAGFNERFATEPRLLSTIYPGGRRHADWGVAFDRRAPSAGMPLATLKTLQRRALVVISRPGDPLGRRAQAAPGLGLERPR